jgi:hypothetical protein
MPLVAFEPAIPASKQLQTHALDGTGTVISLNLYYKGNFWIAVV